MSNLTFEEIETLAEDLGGVLIAGAEGRRWVILSLERYQQLKQPAINEVKLTRHPTVVVSPSDYFLENGLAVTPEEEKREREVIDRLNRDIEALKEEIKKRELAELSGEEVAKPQL